jgi:hypothetical protein
MCLRVSGVRLYDLVTGSDPIQGWKCTAKAGRTRLSQRAGHREQHCGEKHKQPAHAAHIVPSALQSPQRVGVIIP